MVSRTKNATQEHLFDTSKIKAQEGFIESLKPEVMYSGAFGAGKSRVGLEKGHFLNLKYPGNVGAVFRKTFTSLRYTTMETYFRDVMPADMLAKSNFNKVTNILTFPNGSRIFFLGIDEPIKIGGLEVGWAFIDEVIELTEEDYIMVLGRARLNTVPFRQVMSATNPGPPTHWMYRRAFLEGKVDVYTSSSLENPFIPDDYREVLNGFTGIYKQRYVLGKWVGFEGLVYGEVWDPQVHMVDPFEIPGDWPKYRVIDFGYTNPFVCQWWTLAKAPKEVAPEDYPYSGFYLYREIYMSQRTVDKHARDIMVYSESVLTTIADWDAGDRAQLEQGGIPTNKANKDISLGIQETFKRIAEDGVHIFRDALVEQDSTLVNMRKPTSTAEEFAVYKWPKTKPDKNEKEVPVDRDNHGMDCMRYLFFTLFGGPSSGNQKIEYGKKPSMVYTPRRWPIERERSWTRRRWGM